MGLSRLADSLKFVLGWEGTKFENVPFDRGGPTKAGIIQATYDAYRKGQKQDVRSVECMSDAEMQDIYQRQYWVPSHAPNAPVGVDLLLFDCAVNMGVVTAIKLFQAALGVVADGEWGPKTQASLDKQGVPHVINAFSNHRNDRYREIAKKPNQDRFLKGWLNRSQAAQKKALADYADWQKAQSTVKAMGMSVAEQAAQRGESPLWIVALLEMDAEDQVAALEYQRGKAEGDHGSAAGAEEGGLDPNVPRD